MRRVLVGLPILVVITLAIFTLTPCMATCAGADELVTQAVHACPRARQLLGDDAKPARLGFACGQTETEGSYGRASWSLPYTGSRGRGTVSYAAEKRADQWRLDAATLEIDDETIDLLACGPAAQQKPATLAQTNADAATANFDGKVLRSTHPTIREGATCRGKLARERGSSSAKVVIECDPGKAESQGTTKLYDGTGSFTLDVRDSRRRDDDRSEYDDSKTTDVDQTPGCRLSSSGETGTLTIWDTSPAYEIVVAL